MAGTTAILCPAMRPGLKRRGLYPSGSPAAKRAPRYPVRLHRRRRRQQPGDGRDGAVGARACQGAVLVAAAIGGRSPSSGRLYRYGGFVEKGIGFLLVLIAAYFTWRVLLYLWDTHPREVYRIDSTTLSGTLRSSRRPAIHAGYKVRYPEGFSWYARMEVQTLVEGWSCIRPAHKPWALPIFR